jgi:predicted deacylase
MRVETVGDGEPEVAVVGAIHGDEPCGARAIDRFLETSPPTTGRRAAKVIVANERALAAGDRYVDVDLNRSFPGDPEADAHERRLAHALREEIDGLFTLGFHSTVSFDEPFGTLAGVDRRTARLMQALPLAHAADFAGVVEGRSVNLPGFVNVEAGYQGSAAAAETAYACLVAFLEHAGVLPGDPDGGAEVTAHYRVESTIEKEPGRSYEAVAANFRRVDAGDPYARVDGEPLYAERPFWPVLLSGDGHDRLLGYRARRTGPIDEAVRADAG